MTAVLRISGVSKLYGGFRAVNNVSFEVDKFETLALIGPNGAGKTTLFKLLTGETRTSSGAIAFEGNDITHMAAYQRVHLGVGRTFQVARIFPEYSALENVILAIETRQHLVSDSKRSWYAVHPQAEVFEEAAERLHQMGMRANHLSEARELSLGDRKRLELTLTLALEPSMLMLDEPTAGMSPSDRNGIIDLIGKIRSDLNLTVLFTEHDMDFVFGLAHRLVVLNQGEIVASGSPTEVKNNSIVKDIYLGKMFDDAQH